MNQRSELSPKNKYYISKYRYLELKNFCLQYPDWKKALTQLSPLKAHFGKISSGNFSDPTADNAILIDKYQSLISIIDTTAKQADAFLAPWIIKGVTENYSYEYLHLKLEMPTSRDTYYDRYRKFFWILDSTRN